MQQQLADFASNLQWEDLPPRAQHSCVALLTDAVANMIGGSSAEGIAPLLEQIREWGGSPQSQIAVFGDRVPAPQAALANAAMLHALDYDDTFDLTKVHATVCVVPAVLALADAKGPCSGRDVLAACAAGLEIACRLSLGAGKALALGWLPTTLFGSFGAAAAASRMLDLSAEQTAHALGIIWTQAAGNRQGLLDGALTKRIQPAFYAQAATVSALLARRNITGAARAFDGDYGLFPLVVGDGWSAASVTEGLGSTYVLEQIGIKPYPCCRLSHPVIEAALDLVEQYNIAPSHVESVTAHLPDVAALNLVGRPFEIRRSPQVDAQFSVAYCIAAAIKSRRLGLEQFAPASILDNAVATLAAKVHPVLDAKRANSVSILLTNGRVVTKNIPLPLGHPDRPLSESVMAAKFSDCSDQSVRPLGDTRVRRLLSLLNDFASSDDTRELLKSTCP